MVSQKDDLLFKIFFQTKEEISDLIKFVMCALVSRVQMTFYIITKACTVPGNQCTHDKSDKKVSKLDDL